MIIIEEEARQLRDRNAQLESDNQRLTQDNEALLKEQKDVGAANIEYRLQEELQRQKN